MRRSQRSLFRVLVGVVVAVVASVAAGTARADTVAPPVPASELVDTSHQVGDIQKQILQMQAKGQSARSGKLAAAATCGFEDASQVFAPWGDLADYALAPQGDLVSTSGWTFKHTALAADHDPFTAGSSSLLFGQGDSEAISPAMCVDLSNPTMRLFLKDTGGNGKSAVKVDVLYEGIDGHVKHLTLAKLRVGSDWAPSITIPIAVNILSVANASGLTAIAFDFKVEGLQKNETLSLDSFYVDPFLHR